MRRKEMVFGESLLGTDAQEEHGWDLRQALSTISSSHVIDKVTEPQRD